jgi:hypothetical protein
MLTFHQEETCEAIIRHLEIREGQTRRDVRVRDVGNHTPAHARVEMTFWLGEQLYAMEHTGIEPFEGFMEHQNRAPALFAPLETKITTALGALLEPGLVIEMHMPVEAFDDLEMHQVRRLQSALVEHVRAIAPTLPVRRYADYRSLVTRQPPLVPFEVSLVRFDGIRDQPGRFQLKHLTRESKQPREPRIQRACEAKFPKLAVWKRSHRARTILVLEDNDLQLTNHIIVAETFLPIAKTRTDVPDETYLVSTCSQPWYACPILVNGQNCFELEAISHPIHFEIDVIGKSGASF